MPTRQLPKTAQQRLSALSAVADRVALFPPNEVPVPTPVVDHLAAFLPVYIGLIKEVNKAKALQTESTAEVTPLLRVARIWVGQGFQHIVDAVLRDAMPATMLTVYGMLPGARGPRLKKGEQDVLIAAEKLQVGETYRVAHGGEPMAFPSLAEIMVHVDAFRSANHVQANRKLALADAQQNLRKANVEARKLVLRLWNSIETAYDTGDRPSMRRKARHWGVIYSIAKGERAEDGDAQEQPPLNG
ncbi:MAG: hypothetical protein K9J06_14760 [Flavobacteriales bacterium]|nr:hypothetical protein [Flavobacteriales bacterium]